MLNARSRRAAAAAAALIAVGLTPGVAAAAPAGTSAVTAGPPAGAGAVMPGAPVRAGAARGAAGRALAAPAQDCGKEFNDALPETPWALRRLQPSAAWPLSRGRGVTVAVIDSGVSRHPKLKTQLLPGTDYVPGGGTAGDCDKDGHGTLVAGIIAASDGGGRSTDAPYYGVAPDARILPARVLPDSKWSAEKDLPTRIATAITWAVNQKAQVINLSLETEDTKAMRDAVAYAASKDVVVVAAAGNQGGGERADQPVYPAAYDSVIAVAGIDQNGKRVSTSNSGDYVDVAAPGHAIVGPAPRGEGYVLDAPGGTSFAAAYVSGVAALVRARWPDLSPKEVARRIELTADSPPGGRNNDVGYGVVNPYRAVATILEPYSEQRGGPAAGAVPPANRLDDPLRTTRLVAISVAVCGSVFAALVFLVRSLSGRTGRPTGAART